MPSSPISTPTRAKPTSICGPPPPSARVRHGSDWQRIAEQVRRELLPPFFYSAANVCFEIWACPELAGFWAMPTQKQ
ncbi:hypothetical protein BQ8482_80117 [Mesorhizobium delmotii]|uniref:Uncharacterized protein n=1 Tax=Mesorhizobium delmotii TaxID=1631247 RepID=A0A2P9AWC9_9HYPH|nr:hypothetical protein BQ8482_80117 [Mesorhizobium delmotii]